MHKNWQQWEKSLKKIAGLSVHKNASLKNKTSFSNMSSAKWYVVVEQKNALKQLIVLFNECGLDWKKDWDVLGKGSNTLFKDEGYAGCIVDLSKAFASYECISNSAEGKTYKVGAGLSNVVLLNHLRKEKLKGFGYVFGIPGSIGGGLIMNAGTPLGWFGQNVISVEGYHVNGEYLKWDVSEKDFEYRSFKKKKDFIVTELKMFFQASDDLTIEQEIKQAKEKRKNQPLDKPNFGSVFKNPLPLFAGQLIEKALLKGTVIGDAKISEQHANFIINQGHAKCSDALALIALMKSTVKTKFNVDLQQEVIVMGDAS
ncbi:MAG TPA: UDP-N-acetylmuramate dehydrogenase [Oligoflexia bacterium]|nr:UDP-N-acetylmuramate dehydrogenase [Oligoflexia bacterium]HMR24526.1 UDP-N-acetylmuramate dehydrogenase [Oligoflexia bacterium]